MKKMKCFECGKKSVLIVISTLSGGGAERIASILGTELQERDYDVHFLTFYDTKDKYDFKGKYTTRDEKFSTSLISKGWKLFSRAKDIAKYCKEYNIDITISFMEESNFPNVLSKIFGNKSKIITSIRNNPNPNSKLYKFLIKKLYPYADLNTCLSKGVENIINNKFLISNTRTIYNMQNIDKNVKLSKKKLPEKYKELFEDSFNFINIGRLNNQKAQWSLIRAFKKVNEEKSNTNLLILGKGKLKKKLQKLIKDLDLEDSVFLLGFQDNPFVFLRKSDCFVLSSLYEGFGNVIIESLSLDKSVISTDCDFGPREILAPELNLKPKIQYPYQGEYGILTKVFDQKQIFKTLEEKPLSREEKMLANQMMNIIKNEDLRNKYSEKASSRANDFRIDKIIEGWEEII